MSVLRVAASPHHRVTPVCHWLCQCRTCPQIVSSSSTRQVLPPMMRGTGWPTASAATAIARWSAGSSTVWTWEGEHHYNDHGWSAKE